MAGRGASRIHVSPVTVARSAGRTCVTFTATAVGTDAWSETIALQCTGADSIEPMGEAALATFLLPAMRRGADLEISSPVSAVVLREVGRIQGLYAEWEDRHHPVQVIAPAGEDVRLGDGVGLFFSAGVDSFHTLLTTEQPLTHLVFVSGYDAYQRLTRRNRDAAAAVRQVAEDRGLELIVVDTNVRSNTITGADWRYGHGTALFAVAHSLRGVLGRCVISATSVGEAQPAWGTHPQLDPLWSSGSVQVIHEGIETSRWEKLRLVAAHALARKYLRVCGDPSADAYNCGYCGKCTMTRVALHAAGELEAVETLPSGLRSRDVTRIRVNSPLNQGLLTESLRAFDAAGNKTMAMWLRRRLTPTLLGRLGRRVPGVFHRS